MLRLSYLLVRTLREAPADIDLPGQRLLLRAGLIRRAAGGGLIWMPLGQLIAGRIEKVVVDELAASGGLDVRLPTVVPGADRRGQRFPLTSPHLERFALLVKELGVGARDLPLCLYQLGVEPHGGEARPRLGALADREARIARVASFETAGDDDAASDRLSLVVTNIFERLGLAEVTVPPRRPAKGPAVGPAVGPATETFLWPLANGHDVIASCAHCGELGEALTVAAPVASGGADFGEDQPPARVEDTPATPTIATLVDALNGRPEWARADGPWTAAHTLKNVLVTLRFPDGRTEPLCVGLPGDREVDPARLAAALGAAVEPFGEAEFSTYSALVKGYIGPGVLGLEGRSGIRYLLDPAVRAGTVWVTGADAPGRHVIGLVCGRDFVGDGVVAATEPQAGDPCPRCGRPIDVAAGVALARLSRPAPAFAETVGLRLAGRDGRPLALQAVSAWVALTSVLAAVAEAHHDEQGLCWPADVAPAAVHLVVAAKGDEAAAAAESLAADLESAGLTVLLDDRPGLSAGVRLNDADLLGCPTIVIVGRRIAEGMVEVKDRRSGHRADVPQAELAGRLRTPTP